MGDPGFAPAKINLFLHITGRRADGYHLLDSLAVFAGVGDQLTHAPAPDLSLRITGPFAGSLIAEPDNLVLRAARALAEATGVPATGALTLEKNIPVASGIGGGSADAAAALRVLSAAWAVRADLASIASGLGADVPVCLDGHARRMLGVGEILSPAPALPPFGLLLVNPGVPLSTPAVFRARVACHAYSDQAVLPATWDTAAAMAAELSALRNDLQPAAIELVPRIADVLATIGAAYGCLLARMSGSGATCFGIFADGEAARAAARWIKRDGWWVWGG